MKERFSSILIKWLLALLLMIPVSAIASETAVIGEDGKPVTEEEKITKGIGIIDEISFEKGYVIIDDTKYLFDDDLVLINKGKKYASRSLFTEGTRVVWTVKAEKTALVLDHYPFDASEAAAGNKEDSDSGDTQAEKTATDQGSDEVILGEDGVYRN